MKKSLFLTSLIFLSLLLSCNTQNEVLLEDCNAFGGKIRYNGELYTGKVKDIRNGVLKSEFTVENGQHEGEDIHYFSDGKSISKINKWKNGVIVETTFFDKSGKQIGKE